MSSAERLGGGGGQDMERVTEMGATDDQLQGCLVEGVRAVVAGRRSLEEVVEEHGGVRVYTKHEGVPCFIGGSAACNTCWVGLNMDLVPGSTALDIAPFHDFDPPENCRSDRQAITNGDQAPMQVGRIEV